MSKIDNHIHSNFSDDAEFHPNKIVELAKEAGVEVISIADHNNANAYAHFDYKNVEGITIIPAIELDCTIDGINLHVLGYGIDPNAEIYKEIFNGIMEQEKTAGLKRIELVNQLGIVADKDTLVKKANGRSITGESIAEVALSEKQNDYCELLFPYRKGGTRSDNPLINFYWDFCAPGKPAYAPLTFITLDEAIKAINSTGGIAVLAHPGNNIHEDEELLDKIMDSGVVGIEVYSSYHTLEQIEFYHRKAKEYNCLITCGSDFHGKSKPTIKIGKPITKESDEELKNALFDALSGLTR